MKHVCVVFGGNGPEASVSHNSSRFIINCLKSLNYKISELSFSDNLLEDIKKINPDVVFNSMHGTWGEDGTLPALLDFLKIPYTHSGKKASEIAINKPFVKQIAESIGIPTLKSKLYSKQQILNNEIELFEISFLKPYSEGSTIGCFKFYKKNGISTQDLNSIKLINSNFFILEEFFEGKEVAIGIFGDNSIGGIQICPQEGYYDYNAKYVTGKTKYYTPPKISHKILAKMEDLTLKLHQTINASCISRADFLVNGEDFKFLEINTHPGFTEHSLIPKIANNAGISAKQIVQFLVENATFQSYSK